MSLPPTARPPPSPCLPSAATAWRRGTSPSIRRRCRWWRASAARAVRLAAIPRWSSPGRTSPPPPRSTSARPRRPISPSTPPDKSWPRARPARAPSTSRLRAPRVSRPRGRPTASPTPPSGDRCSRSPPGTRRARSTARRPPGTSIARSIPRMATAALPAAWRRPRPRCSTTGASRGTCRSRRPTTTRRKAPTGRSTFPATRRSTVSRRLRRSMPAWRRSRTTATPPRRRC